ncbi:MAG TPA: sortase [Nevskiaceae bacterium]|nr:sortase [Nevskiaceae bacterium]
MAKAKQTNKKKHVIPKPVFSYKRDLLPPMLGGGSFLIVLAVLSCQWVTAQVKYRNAHLPAKPSVVAATKQPIPVADIPPNLWIPRLNLSVPLVFEPQTDQAHMQKALQRGVLHYGNSASPGKPGNMTLVGYSSNQPWAPGKYNFVFTLLDKLRMKDQIIIDYHQVRYIYTVSESRILSPDNTTVLKNRGQQTVTLLTGTPIASDDKRLAIIAEQVSPAPPTKGQPATSSMPASTKLPGAAPSMWQSFKTLITKD